jgi:hypothetical protein
MGLLDVLQGTASGPRSQSASAGGGGMSPITMGLLALLAYKSFKGGGPLAGIFGSGAGSAPNPGAPPGGTGNLVPVHSGFDSLSLT